jgi:hypothetical protein
VPGLDFSRLTGPSAADTKIHPRDIFAALPARSSRYEYLRDVQREVFDTWMELRTKRDLVIKMNTGNGKTLVGLMLLKSALNEHVGPAAYLTPDPVYLVDQVEAAAADLGLSTSRDPRDPAVASGSAILLATVKTLFNGRSKFGVAPEGRKIKLGTVLIDDAHACLATVEEQFEIRLVTHFGADPDCISTPIHPGAADDIGDRMILAPQEVRPDWSDETIRDYVTELARNYNVVVIVPSASRAEFWRDVANAELYAGNLREGIERLKSRTHGLVTLVNKYDGVDLPDDACRVLVIDGLPEAYSGIDRIEAAALDDTVAMMGRQLQRIEQGMGRGIRSRDDYCVVLLLGARLIRRLHDPAAIGHFSTATAAQLQLSRLVAEQLAEGDADLHTAVEQCLTRDKGWVLASRNALVGVSYGSGHVAPTAAAVRRAADLAGQQRYTEAIDAQQIAVNAADDPRERGWLKQQLAAYLHPVDPVRAQQQQVAALDDNPALLRPRQGIAYVRLRGRAGDQAEAAAAYMSERYASGSDLLIAVNAVLDALAFDTDPAAVDPFEQAVADLGAYLGFTTQRPERDVKRGPDDLWAFGGHFYAVIECKSAAVTDFIRKTDLDQLSGSLSWFREEYELPASAVPVIIHPSNKVHRSGAAPAGCRVITKDTLPKLRDAVRAWATALAGDDLYRNPDAVCQQLEARKLKGRSSIEAYARNAITSA